jgi:TolA-binding protein
LSLFVQIQNAVRQATEQLQDLQQLQQQREQQHHHIQVDQLLEDQQKLRHQQQQQQQRLRQQEQQQQLRDSCQPLTVKCEPELWGSSRPRSRSPLSLTTSSSSPRSPILAATNNAARPVQRPHFPPPPPLPPQPAVNNTAVPNGTQSTYISPKMTFANGSPKNMFSNGSPPGQQMGTRLELPADENIQLEELEDFAKEFKQRRIKLGYTQVNFSVEFHSIFTNVTSFLRCF